MLRSAENNKKPSLQQSSTVAVPLDMLRNYYINAATTYKSGKSTSYHDALPFIEQICECSGPVLIRYCFD